MSEVSKMRKALAKIAKIAAEVSDEEDGGYEPGDDGNGGGMYLTCTPKSLPERLNIKSAEVARQVNPVNAPPMAAMSQFDPGLVGDPARIAVMTTKYWGPSSRRLTVSFLETTAPDLRRRIVSHMNAWQCSITFVETASGGQVRISRGAGGYYSYLGTDVLLIPRNRQTMNLESFTMNTPESEYRRVVRHETGHSLGFPHEHLRRQLVARIDPTKAYAYFWRTQHWDRAMVDAQVLTPLSEGNLMGTPVDQTSIMCYQLPGSITRDGRPIIGGTDIDPTDAAFAHRIYPAPGRISASPAEDSEAFNHEEWDEAEDVEPVLDCD